MSGPSPDTAKETFAMDETTPSRRPPFDPTAFVFGALFLVIAVVGLLDPDVSRRIDLGLLIPTTIVVIGGALLVGSELSARRDRPGARARR